MRDSAPIRPGPAIPASTDRAAEVSAATGRLARSAGIIGTATMASRILGLVREQVLAYLFGAGNEMDAFNVAFRIPNVLRDLFGEGAMSAAFVPVFTRRLTLQGRERAWASGSNVLNAVLLATLVFVAIGVAGASPLARLFAPDYAHVPGKLALTIALTRVLFPFLAFVTVAAVFMAMLNSLHRFFVPAVAPALFNVATIVSVIALVPVMRWLGWPTIMAVALGALIGGLAQAAVQWPAMRAEGFRHKWVLDWRDEGLRETLVLMGPGLLGLAALQVNLFVNTVLATSQGTGAASWLNYAFRLIYMPIGLFGVSIATAALPGLSAQAARDDLDGIRTTVSSGLRMMLMLNVPATGGLIALATPIVALLFQHGQFTQADTAATASALALYAIGLVGYSAGRFLVPVFYTLHDSRTPLAVSVATVTANVVLNLLLVRVMGFRGLALGTALAATFHAVLLYWLLSRRLHGIDERRLVGALARILAASAVMVAAALACDAAISHAASSAHLAVRLARVSADIAVALAVLAGIGRLLGIAELESAIRLVRAGVAERLGRA